MRVMIMFDLPTDTKEERRLYSKFRKGLISEGFLMMQYSIYIKCCINKDAANSSVNYVKRILPPHGHVRALTITEKQYEKMKILLGDEDKNIEILGDNRTILF